MCTILTADIMTVSSTDVECLCVVNSAHPSMMTQSAFSQVNTCAVSSESSNSMSSVYKATVVSTAVTGVASFHAPSMNQYASSFSTPGVDGSVSGHTTATKAAGAKMKVIQYLPIFRPFSLNLCNCLFCHTVNDPSILSAVGTYDLFSSLF